MLANRLTVTWSDSQGHPNDLLLGTLSLLISFLNFNQPTPFLLSLYPTIRLYMQVLFFGWLALMAVCLRVLALLEGCDWMAARCPGSLLFVFCSASEPRCSARRPCTSSWTAW